jgi:hypothetical protein
MSMQQNIYGNTRKNSEGIQNVYENTEKISEDTQNIIVRLFADWHQVY